MYMANLGRAHIFVWSLGRTFLSILPFPAANSVIIVLVNVGKSVLLWATSRRLVAQAGVGRVDHLKQLVHSLA